MYLSPFFPICLIRPVKILVHIIFQIFKHVRYFINFFSLETFLQFFLSSYFSQDTLFLGLWHSYHSKDFLSLVLCVDPAFHSLHLLPSSFLFGRVHLVVAYLKREVRIWCWKKSIFYLLIYMDLIFLYWPYIDSLVGMEF